MRLRAITGITVSKDIIIIASINCRHEPIEGKAEAIESVGSMINENKYRIECLRTILSQRFFVLLTDRLNYKNKAFFVQNKYN